MGAFSETRLYGASDASFGVHCFKSTGGNSAEHNVKRRSFIKVLPLYQVPVGWHGCIQQLRHYGMDEYETEIGITQLTGGIKRFLDCLIIQDYGQMRKHHWNRNAS